jgi:Mlc titration factor MtfA (ptsG expression regulator)
MRMKTKEQAVNGKFPKVPPLPAEADAQDWSEEAARALEKMGSQIDLAVETHNEQIRELYAYVAVLVRRQNDADHDRARLWADLKKRTRKHPAKNKKESKR